MKTTPRFQAITDRSLLDGTVYVELLAGAYARRCWNDGSLFFDEEVFGYLEPTIEKHVPTYDHYAFTKVSMADWKKIVADLANVSELLSVQATRSSALDRVGFHFINSQAEFTEDLDASCAAFSALIQQVEEWTAQQQSAHDCVTVLGI